MWNTFSHVCHLLSVYDCACVPFQGVSGKVEGTEKAECVQFCRLRMQREFPADYTEVKQGGPDKRKTIPVPHHTNL